MIRESALTSATLYRLSDGAERMFFRLTLVADDFGRFDAEPQILKARCFPRWPDQRLPMKRVVGLYAELEAELVTSYVVDGRRYGFFNTWDKHQQRRAKTSKYPDPSPDNICTHPLADVPVVGVVIGDVIGVGNTSPATQEPAAASRHAGETWGSPEQLVALYNRLIPPGHPQVTRLSPARRRKAVEYLRTFPEHSFWMRVFSEIRHSGFLQRGSQKSPNFRGDFDWLLTRGQDKTENCVKVAEGKYRDSEDR